MKTLLISMALLVSSVGGVAAQSANPLEKLQGKKRPVLLFAKSRSDARLNRQESILRDFRPGLSERDMIVLRTAGNEETRSAIGYTSINNGTARQLRRIYAPEDRGLTVVLIGKDGSEKKRWNRVVQPQEIFDIIDAMPMRQDEIKKQNATN